MRKSVNILSIILLVVLTSFSNGNVADEPIVKEPIFSFNQYACELYECINNDGDINEEAFNIALKGYYSLLSNNELENKKYLTIVDMSLSSNTERFYVIDMELQQLVYRSLVAHGRNTGEEFAYNFSNKQSSYQTSLGFYKTAETYDGKRGFSMKLDGLEYSNSNARDRGVIIHGADYVSKKFITENGRLGRSLGCPSLPMNSFVKVVEMLKEGSCLFVYYPQKYYLSKSKMVNAPQDYLLTNSGILAE
ncbi:MAG: murein L,D-transpeptidase catalytic domain family protein [Flavobacteriales bacterium]|nr:murein L,D-transpeptidase catalytic domain family protein [Flavobacteriales bacterium]